jgi:hypothetical protein
MVNLIVVVGNATPEENGIFMNERAPKEVGVALPGLFCENICTRGGVFSQASAADMRLIKCSLKLIYMY